MANTIMDVEEIRKHLPTEEAINEYVDFVNKEMVILEQLWKPIFTGDNKTTNELIINHCVNITDYFTEALKIASLMKNPELVAQILEQVPDSDSTKFMELVHAHNRNCHHGE